VSGEFTGEEELDGSLDLTRWESSALVESNELRRFKGDSFEGVIDERVHDVHGFLGNTNIRVDLLQYLEDIDSESLWSSLFILSDSCGSLFSLFISSGSLLVGSHLSLDGFLLSFVLLNYLFFP
jgi:hypothetical protein